MKYIKKLFLPLLGILFLTNCNKDNVVVLTPTYTSSLDQLINSRTDLSITAAAISRAKLNTFTQGGGPFTIFAPSNVAWANAGYPDVASINTIDSNVLAQMLVYFIQPVSRTFLEIPLGPNATMSTQNGLTQYASRYVGGSAFVNGATLTETNIMASNGIVHIINNMIFPATINVLNTLTANPNYKRMVQAINKTANTASYGTTAITALAIPDAVMIANSYDSTTIANITGTALTTLSGIIKAHAIPQRIFYSDFKLGNLKSAFGTNLVVSSGINIKGANNVSAIPITSYNYNCTNGVIQIATGLLKP